MRVVQMVDLSDAAAVAVCGVAVRAMIDRGVNPEVAAAFGERACRPLVKGAAKKGGRALKRGAKKVGKKMTRKTQLAINRGRRKAGMKPIKWKRKGR